MKYLQTYILFFVFSILSITANSQKKKESPSTEKKDSLPPISLDAFHFRALGPALMSGRVFDLAFNPQNKAEYYVAVASGGVWKTVNNGVTYEPIFDGEGSYSIGCVTLDPNNPYTVWVGSGEANNQRSAAYGDGIYKSEDGGKSWTNMGLKKSEHIGRIVVDPRNADIVFAAAYGPLWDSGGDRGIYKSTDAGKTFANVGLKETQSIARIVTDPKDANIVYVAVIGHLHGANKERGLYKTTDGGQSWNNVKFINEDTGFTDVVMDPVDNKTLYAASYQRRRTSWATPEAAAAAVF